MSVLSVGRSPVYPFALDIVDMMVPFCWRWLQEQPDGISSAHPYLCRQLSPCPMSDATNRICCELRQGRTHCCWHWGTSLGALCDMKIHTSSLQVLSGKQAFPTWNMVLIMFDGHFMISEEVFCLFCNRQSETTWDRSLKVAILVSKMMVNHGIGVPQFFSQSQLTQLFRFSKHCLLVLKTARLNVASSLSVNREAHSLRNSSQTSFEEFLRFYFWVWFETAILDLFSVQQLQNATAQRSRKCILSPAKQAHTKMNTQPFQPAQG